MNQYAEWLIELATSQIKFTTYLNLEQIWVSNNQNAVLSDRGVPTTRTGFGQKVERCPHFSPRVTKFPLALLTGMERIRNSNVNFLMVFDF